MANPGIPTPAPRPRRQIPRGRPPPPDPPAQPPNGPTGPRTPYPVDDPGVDEPRGPGSEPDYLPGGPTDPGIRL